MKPIFAARRRVANAVSFCCLHRHGCAERSVPHADRQQPPFDPDHGTIRGGVIANRGDLADGFPDGYPDAALVASPADAEQSVGTDRSHSSQVVLRAGRCGLGVLIRVCHGSVVRRGARRHGAGRGCDRDAVRSAQFHGIDAGWSQDEKNCDAHRDERDRVRDDQHEVSRACRFGVRCFGRSGGKRCFRGTRAFALRLVQGVADQAHEPRMDGDAVDQFHAERTKLPSRF